MVGIGGGGAGSVRRIFRKFEHMTRGRTRRRRKLPEDQKPCGPKLVRGRGLARRRRDPLAILSWAGYFALAAAIFIYVVMRWIGPLLGAG